MLNIVLSASGLILLILGLTVYYSNPKSRTNISLAAFILAGLLWVIANLGANIAIANDSTHALLLNRLTLVGASLLPLTYLLFSYTFVGKKRLLSKKRLVCYILPVLFLLATTFSDLNVKSQDGEIVLGPVYYFIIPLFLAYFTYGTVLLAKSYKTADTIKRLQLHYIFWGISFSVIPGLFLNAILPLSGHIETAYFGPSVVIFFALFTSIAIVKHRLLDIRLVVARSLAYLLLITTLVGIYTFVVFGFTARFFAEDSVFVRQIVPIGAALFLAATFSYLKKFFDKITNRFFYRDAYDPQQFLDELNATIVENIELGILLRHTTAVIQSNLKSDYCFVEIKADGGPSSRFIGTGELSISREDNAVMREELIKSGKKTIVTDELSSDSVLLKRILSSNNVGLLVRLIPGSDVSRESLYYLILGKKKSGNIYSRQDIRIIEIIADELLIAIQNSIRFEEIQQFNVTLQEKVNDATLKLQKSNKKLRELDETKDEFISMASHQLRTPLTSVKGYMSMVLEGDAGKLTKQQEALLNQAFVSSQRMVYLIADLLNVSRLKTGKFIIDAQPTDLSEVVEGEIAQLTETAKSKKLKLEYKKPKNFSKLMLDETKIRQVIMNFADNAIYYTPSGGSVYIELKEDQGNIYFIVKDNGLGVPKEDQKHLFTKFYRAGNARKARPDGTGLGLFMAKKVVDAQGGTILFESREGKGSTFGFSFNKKKHSVESSKE
ncbi:MAG TPA: ATP-binding protein [Patescibacteria group bacterium]|nr:ATP-binding protein [Patescibacteria group bacterium]